MNAKSNLAYLKRSVYIILDRRFCAVACSHCIYIRPNTKH